MDLHITPLLEMGEGIFLHFIFKFDSYSGVMLAVMTGSTFHTNSNEIRFWGQVLVEDFKKNSLTNVFYQKPKEEKKSLVSFSI